MNKKKVKKVFDTWKDIKQDINDIAKNKQIQKVQKKIKKHLEQASGSIAQLIKSDFSSSIKKRLVKEQKQVEKILDKVVSSEMDRLKKFFKDQKEKIYRINKKINQKQKKKTSRKKTKVSKKSSIRKKSTQKKIVRKKAGSSRRNQ